MEAGGFEHIVMKEFPPGFECAKSSCKPHDAYYLHMRRKDLSCVRRKTWKKLYDPIIKAYIW
ncbi:hypothetical protein I7I48_01439 [Histoplasma ohiense]|nr:hypothetical protein I7I48_01439 [Histoplasma ohiense (nom. inval.)]